MELDPRTTAAVAVHCQGDVVGPTGAFADFFYQQVTERHVIDQVSAVLGAVRDANGTVVYTRVAWKPDFSDLEVNSPLLGIVAQSGCLKEGSELVEIVEPLKPHGDDIVLTHQRIGAFAGTNLDTILRGKGITTLLFTGVATNASVEGTARVASDLGYRVVIVEDACSAATPEAHRASIDSLGLLAEITTVDEVRTALNNAVAGTPA
ncbi:MULTISPECIES: cysteine hydrolase family protein [unclassified Rhodococcus (in: high G+C Gram-positive bacteria)]|uniref:cysteine hydrolase family protein n=1 Tax=unclassified Rhodococcus (in: high G+C Gram-positive bacteria) TaxID=192944 RepID=UPI00163B4D80|nr:MULTISPECIES: cysteine hydrolase [unclassified Rhodococcus (in: high G+C Gram-positive bacteria)]MBC2641945.1 cysteine hydrolase [Rhodococcus sp. 3A]MBC2893314.1 cysteine hydrolase [Rhodococcus sp. 4CII]